MPLPAAPLLAGGTIALRCRCTTGLHDRCLVRWIFSPTGRDNPQACELCMGAWRGAVGVSVGELLEHAAALKRSGAGTGELEAAMAQLRERTQVLGQLAEAAEAAEAQRQREWGTMRRVAAHDRQVGPQGRGGDPGSSAGP